MAKGITFEILGDASHFKRAVGQVHGSIHGLGAPLKKLGGLFAATFAVGKIKDFAFSAVGAASDLEESTSKVGVVFENLSEQVLRWAENAATAFGMSKQQALEAAGTYGNLFRAMGITNDESEEMSTNLVELAADLASFNNANPEEVLTALRSGLSGETEPLKRFGVNLNMARIEAKALEMGLLDTTAAVDGVGESSAKNSEKYQKLVEKHKEAWEKLRAEWAKGKDDFHPDVTKLQEEIFNLENEMSSLEQSTGAVGDAASGATGELDAAAKAQAVYALIMEDTELAQGDFARTSDGLANKQRILSAQWQDMKAKIGQFLMPAFSGVVNFLSTKAIPGLDSATGAFKNFVDNFELGSLSIGQNKELQKFVTMLQTKFGPAWKAISEAVSEYAKLIIEYIKWLVDFAIKLWERFGKDLFGHLTTALGWIIDGLTAAFEIIAGIFKLFRAILTGDWGAAWDAIKQIVANAWKLIYSAVRAGWELLHGLFDVFRGTLMEVWDRLWDAIAGAIDWFWDHFIIAPIRGYIDTMKWIIENGLNAVKGIAERIMSAFTWPFKQAFNAIAKMWNNTIGGLSFKAPSWIPGIGGKGFEVPELPTLRQYGGPAFGWTRVGERGPENVWLPHGSYVSPNHNSDPGGGGTTIIVNAETNANPNDIANELAWALKTVGR